MEQELKQTQDIEAIRLILADINKTLYQIDKEEDAVHKINKIEEKAFRNDMVYSLDKVLSGIKIVLNKLKTIKFKHDLRTAIWVGCGSFLGSSLAYGGWENVFPKILLFFKVFF